MGEEYKPTRKVQQGGGGYDRTPQGEHRPTVPVGGQGGRRDYGPAAGRGGANKTMRLEKEPPSFAWLVMTEGAHAGHIFRLHSDATLVGRDPSCDVVVDDQAVSRQHAKIRVNEGEEDQKIFVLHDMATENGTFVNDEQIVKHELEDGDRIKMGRAKLVFKQVQL